MAPITLNGPDELRAAVGRELAVSDWHELSQEEVARFAEVTGDDYWLHVDAQRAAQTPLGGTIVHGLFTLSLGPKFLSETFDVQGFGYALNYGYNKVRFTAPMPVGGRVRMRVQVIAADDVPGGIQITVLQTFEREGAEKPVCVAEWVMRYLSA
ncbi:unannotated protein [freshwater metagenome]|uniref:Unannotated protein n=1 Tax=freshwater metagenome TaxID=449393 RepID=A0A6J7CT54_9ZZZZ|nr:MaoC family dehydratase [Actinomycetota bacterium]